MEIAANTLSQNGSLATARWADPDYIAEKYYWNEGDIWLGRNPHNFDQGLGYKDDRHMIVCAGNRSGKGRSFIINNLALWPGSTVTYDPKGEIPHIMAPRRGDGDEYCMGMGQEVFVLDPLGHSGVDKKYLGYFDPLAGLDPEDGELATWAARIADAIIEMPQGGDAAKWAKEAKQIIALLIMHVVTSGDFQDHERTLFTVLTLLLEGEKRLYDRVLEASPSTNKADIPDPFTLLFQRMLKNDGCRGWIRREASGYKEIFDKTPKYWTSIRGEASSQLSWFKSAGIEHSMVGWGDESRRFDPTKLKTDEISVFIVMPVEDLKTYGAWVQAVFTGIFAAMRRIKTKPKHQVLTFLDEFSSLGYQEYIASSLDNIAGEGMKLAIIVQNFGKLKKLYGDEMESFFTNSGLELFFGKVGDTALNYIKHNLGETEVIKYAKTRGKNKSLAKSIQDSYSFSIADSKGGSESLSVNKSETVGQTDSWNASQSINIANAESWGKGNGHTMGRNYGPGIFHLFADSTNYGTSFNRNRGGSHTRSHGETSGTGGSNSLSQTSGMTKTEGSSWNTTNTQTVGRSQGLTVTEGESLSIGESFHKKFLLEPHEFNAFFNPVPWEYRDHPAYPGLALVRIQGEPPFFIRRSNYDQDPFFEGLFSADRTHGFVPLNEVPLLGYQYTEKHIFPVHFTKKMIENEYQGEPLVRRMQRIEKGDELFVYQDMNGSKRRVHAPCPGRVVDIASDDMQKITGHILTIKADIPITANDREAFATAIFGNDFQLIEQKEKLLMIEDQNKQKKARAEWEKELNRIREGWREFEGFKRHKEYEFDEEEGTLTVIGRTIGGIVLWFAGLAALAHVFDFVPPQWLFWPFAIFAAYRSLNGALKEKEKALKTMNAAIWSKRHDTEKEYGTQENLESQEKIYRSCS